MEELAKVKVREKEMAAAEELAEETVREKEMAAALLLAEEKVREKAEARVIFGRLLRVSSKGEDMDLDIEIKKETDTGDEYWETETYSFNEDWIVEKVNEIMKYLDQDVKLFLRNEEIMQILPPRFTHRRRTLLRRSPSR